MSGANPVRPGNNADFPEMDEPSGQELFRGQGCYWEKIQGQWCSWSIINDSRRGNCFQQGCRRIPVFLSLPHCFPFLLRCSKMYCRPLINCGYPGSSGVCRRFGWTQIAQSFNVAVYCFRTWFSEPYPARYEYRFWRTGKHCGIERMVRRYLARPPVHSGCDY